MSDGFRARDIGLRAQKKILGRMAANKSTRKMFIDDTTASLLDHLYQLVLEYTKNKKETEKIMKNIIKTVIKVGVLFRNDEFNTTDLEYAENFKVQLHTTAMAILSFHGVDFTYDRQFLVLHLTEAHANLRRLVQRHLKDKSLQRIDAVFQLFTDPQFLDTIFKRDSQRYKEILDNLVEDINFAMDENNL